MKIGILGGTFNPPHIGHLILAQEILFKLRLDKIFFVPANIPPHKNKELTPAYHRINMIKLAIKENNKFEVLDWEIKRGGISYTVDTLRELKNAFPKDELYLIIGSDLANDFSNWKDYKEIFRLAKVVVALREGSPLKEKDKSIPLEEYLEKNTKEDIILVRRENPNLSSPLTKFILVEVIQIKISSSLIRSLIKRQMSVRYLLSEEVEKYIKEKRLYQTEKERR
ncbi:MAG: hypothetical protein B6D56_05440 [Candidatus Omnitrophica bacterium 4484_70.1]|nr:MAG: hypothetical protein B6D56_05440 [Candidatus Omnitrophica bacterium 4484_70.1]